MEKDASLISSKCSSSNQWNRRQANCETVKWKCTFVPSFLFFRYGWQPRFLSERYGVHRTAPLRLLYVFLVSLFGKLCEKFHLVSLWDPASIFASWAACLRSLAFRFPPLIFLWNIHAEGQEVLFLPFSFNCFFDVPHQSRWRQSWGLLISVIEINLASTRTKWDLWEDCHLYWYKNIVFVPNIDFSMVDRLI